MQEMGVTPRMKVQPPHVVMYIAKFPSYPFEAINFYVILELNSKFA